MVCVSRSPMWVNVLPASVVLYMPSPNDEVWRLLGSPVPMYTMFGLVWSMAMSPIDAEPYCSKTGTNVVPAFTDLYTPPTANPIQMMRGSLSETATSSMRPPMLVGPMDRNRNVDSSGFGERLMTPVSLRIRLDWALANDAAKRASAAVARRTKRTMAVAGTESSSNRGGNLSNLSPRHRGG